MSSVKRQGVGARLTRKEDKRHLHGRGSFIANMTMPGLSEVAFMRSPVAHAEISSIEIDDSAVNQVITREQMDCSDIIANSTLPTYQSSSLPPLASGKVRYVGEPVAMAFARTRAEAEDLTEQVFVNYEDLPTYANTEQSLAATSDLIHDGWNDNVFVTLRSDVDFEKYAAQADRVVSHEVELSRQCMLPMEGMAILAYWDHQQDQLIVYCASQIPHMHRRGFAEFLGLDQEQVRVISPDVGGAFGYKCVVHAEELSVAWLAKTYKKPFRYVQDRREHLIVGANTREHQYKLNAHVSNDGRLLAVDAEITIDGGAYSVWPFTIGLEVGQAAGNLPGPYDFRGYRSVTRGVATNKPGFMPYRGVARAGVCYAIEQLMDTIAFELDMEPWEVRLKNLVKKEQMPYINVANKHYDGGDYPESLRRALQHIGAEKIRERQAKGEADGRLIGLGVATYTEQSAHGTSVFAAWGTAVIPGHDQAFMRMTPDGGLEISVGVHSHGQGMETTFAQIANEILGVDISRIRLIHGDTGRTPFSTGTYASRSLVMSGGAVSKASKALAPKIKHIAAHLLGGVSVDEIELEDGHAVAGDKRITLDEVARAWYTDPHLLPGDADSSGLEVTVGYKPKVDTGSFTYASNAAVVAVDPETGGVEILDYVVVEDCGTMINPLVVEGQTLGGIVQGIGNALFEEMPYDETGQPLASTLADYIMPGAAEMPHIHIEHMETPSPHTEFGAKGMGEGGGIAPPATIASAINDALRQAGLSGRVNRTPASPERVLQAFEDAEQNRKQTTSALESA